MLGISLSLGLCDGTNEGLPDKLVGTLGCEDGIPLRVGCAEVEGDSDGTYVRTEVFVGDQVFVGSEVGDGDNGGPDLGGGFVGRDLDVGDEVVVGSGVGLFMTVGDGVLVWLEVGPDVAVGDKVGVGQFVTAHHGPDLLVGWLLFSQAVFRNIFVTAS